MRELAAGPLLTSPEGTSTRRLMTDAFAAAGVEPRVAVETEQREAIIPLVVAGAGVAVVPRGVAHAAEGQGATVARLRPPLRRTIGSSCGPRRSHRRPGSSERSPSSSGRGICATTADGIRVAARGGMPGRAAGTRR